MAPGEYVIYFAEVGDNGCSTIRSFPITLGDPFDADILAVTDQCSGADGVVFQNLQDSTTTVNYTIRLNTSSYGSNWRFNFALTTNTSICKPRHGGTIGYPFTFGSDLQQRYWACDVFPQRFR
jgi:hypothetical protein